MSAWVALLHMQRDCLLELQPASLAQARPLRLTVLRPSDSRSLLWNEHVERYHYLGYSPVPSSELRYFVHSAEGCLLALLGFCAAAWTTAPRDHFVGWSPAVRERHLARVVNRARFLILPWGALKNLVSHMLACIERQLPADREQHYRVRPVLLETPCEKPPFEGTCYRAANWIHVGQTQGRGNLDTDHEYNKPVKNIWLKPLCGDWKTILNR